MSFLLPVAAQEGNGFRAFQGINLGSKPADLNRMAFCDERPYGKIAQQRARATIMLQRLTACVFAVSGVSAAWFGRWILAAGFATAAGILACISVFASIKFRKNHLSPPLGTTAFKPKTGLTIQKKSKPSWLAWAGIMLVTSGIAAAAMFFVHASQLAENNTPYQLLGISCLVQALTGVILITHTQRKLPELRDESDVEFRAGIE